MMKEHTGSPNEGGAMESHGPCGGFFARKRRPTESDIRLSKLCGSLPDIKDSVKFTKDKSSNSESNLFSPKFSHDNNISNMEPALAKSTGDVFSPTSSSSSPPNIVIGSLPTSSLISSCPSNKYKLSPRSISTTNLSMGHNNAITPPISISKKRNSDSISDSEENVSDEDFQTRLMRHYCSSDTGSLTTSVSLIIQSISQAEESGDDSMLGVGPETRRDRAYARSNSFVRDDELTDDYFGIRAVLAVHEVLNSDIKTIQSLLDPKMILLRALFDVPEWGEFSNVAGWICTIFQAHYKSMTVVQWAIKQEVQAGTPTTSLFREDSMPTALASNFLRSLGKTYLSRVLGPHIQRMHATKKCYEIDLNRAGGSKANVKRLRTLTCELLKSVFESVSICPRIIREFLYQMCCAIREKYSEENALKTVSSFFFLRFVCPAILYPQAVGILDASQQLTSQAQRALVLAGKIIQNLANGAPESEYAESHMSKINKVIQDFSKPMQTFMEQMSRKQFESPQTAFYESIPTQIQYKSALHDLQKYVAQKIALIPKVQESMPHQETSDYILRLVKLRRALQACSYSWRDSTPVVSLPAVLENGTTGSLPAPTVQKMSISRAKGNKIAASKSINNM